jgi:hypothetical protein
MVTEIETCATGRGIETAIGIVIEIFATATGTSAIEIVTAIGTGSGTETATETSATVIVTEIATETGTAAVTPATPVHDQDTPLVRESRTQTATFPAEEIRLQGGREAAVGAGVGVAVEVERGRGRGREIVEGRV